LASLLEKGGGRGGGCPYKGRNKEKRGKKKSSKIPGEGKGRTSKEVLVKTISYFLGGGGKKKRGSRQIRESPYLPGGREKIKKKNLKGEKIFLRKKGKIFGDKKIWCENRGGEDPLQGPNPPKEKKREEKVEKGVQDQGFPRKEKKKGGGGPFFDEIFGGGLFRPVEKKKRGGGNLFHDAKTKKKGERAG